MTRRRIERGEVERLRSAVRVLAGSEGFGSVGAERLADAVVLAVRVTCATTCAYHLVRALLVRRIWL